MKIYLPEPTKIACKVFAENVLSTNSSEYSRRGQNSPTAIIRQIYEGKLAEFAVYEWLRKSSNSEPSPPDLKIYSAGKKSFAPDITLTNGERIHVKCQNFESIEKYGLSWICQKTDPLVKSPRENDTIVFCILEKDESVEIKSVQPARIVKWGEPKINKLRITKVAFYL